MAATYRAASALFTARSSEVQPMSVWRSISAQHGAGQALGVGVLGRATGAEPGTQAGSERGDLAERGADLPLVLVAEGPAGGGVGHRGGAGAVGLDRPGDGVSEGAKLHGLGRRRGRGGAATGHEGEEGDEKDFPHG